MRKAAFTLLELIFVIVIMGILAKYGVELLSQAYKSFIFSNVNNALQSQSAAAVETIASRLQYRIKDSVIARKDSGNLNDFKPLASSDYNETATILEWIGYDADGFRGDVTTPLWSGIIDLNRSNATVLISPATDTDTLNTLIGTLSNGGSTINDTALYFVGSDSDINNYGWNGVAITEHNTSVIHPIRRSTVTGEENLLIPTRGDNGADNSFAGVNVYEYYQLAWTAYAVVHSTDGNLTLHYDYQPWKGENYNSNGVKKQLIMQNVDTFRFRAAGSIIKIQVCVNSDLVEDYSLCKEKTIF